MKCKYCGVSIPNKKFLTRKGERCIGCDNKYHNNPKQKRKTPKKIIFEIQYLFNSMRRNDGWEKGFVKQLEITIKNYE